MTSLSSRPGDSGQTSLRGEVRVWKDSPQVELLGTLDELNAHLGLARSLGLPASLDALLRQIQQQLCELGTELAAAQTSQKLPLLHPEHVQTLETQIAQWESQLPALRDFLLPGGSPAACQLHVARTVCRRAERRLTSLVRQTSPGVISPILQAYLNRLGDLLFVLARTVNLDAGFRESTWKNPFPQDSTP